MNRLLLTVPAALLVSTGFLFAAAGPAMAAPDERCAVLPAQLRDAAGNAETRTARKALGYISIGEKLCEAGNERAAAKKFTAAMKTLGVEQAEQIATLQR